MKIVQFLHGNKLGGMEKFCIDLANVFAKEHEIILLGDKTFKEYANNNVKFVELDITKNRNNIFLLWKLYKLFKGFSPDIIHVHKQKSIHILKRLAPFLHIPFVATKHDIQVKKTFYGLEYSIAISDEILKSIKAQNIYKIYNGIPYTEPQKIMMPQGFNIVAVGGLRKVKEYELLVKSVSHLTFPFHLTIVGEGVLRENLTKLIKELEIEDKVSLVGFQTNVNDYIYSADLQVISSKSEGFSLAMIEGIFYSKRLISTKVSGCMEILPDELLYDIENLTEKITDVYENKERYQQSFARVKEIYQELLTIEACAKEHLNVYEEIIENFRVMK